MNTKLANIWMSLTGTICLTVIFIYFYQFIAPEHQMGWDALADFLGALFLSALLSLAISILLAIKAKGQFRQILFWVFTIGAIVLVSATWYFIREQNREQQQIEREIRPKPPTSPTMEGKMSLGYSTKKNSDKSVLDPLPLGMVKLKFEKNTALHFLNSSLDNSTSFDSLVWNENTQISYAPPWFACEILKADYQIGYLELVTKSQHRLEVVVNKFDGKSAWIDRSEAEVMDFPDFLLNMFAIEPHDTKANPLRQKPLDHASAVTLPKGQLIFSPKLVKVNWIQVDIFDMDMKHKGSGWLKWSDRKHLLVNYSFLS